ncbi:MAG: hypothetical protein LUH54_03640, partial [Firmicutes bacterium]|nr:hypothetical protein [Bacillota bacterium]
MAESHVPIKYRKRRVRRRTSTVGRAGRRKIPTAVIFVCVFVICCIVGTVMLGNYLLDKVEEPPETTEPTTTSGTSSSHQTSGLSNISSADGNVRAGCLDISDTSNLEIIRERVDFIYESGYDSILIPVSDGSGELYFLSDVAVALSRMSSDADLPTMSDILRVINESAESYGITPKVTIYYVITSGGISDAVLYEAAVLYDTAVITECTSLGADEVLLSGIEVNGSGEDDISAFTSFIEKVKEADSDITLGAAFGLEIYQSTDYAALLESISSCVSFLAVDISSLDMTYTDTDEIVYTTDEDGSIIESTETVRMSSLYSELSEAAESIKGSISLYGLSFLLYGDDTYILSESIDAIYSAGAYSFYVITPTQ